jgi:phage-related protein
MDIATVLTRKYNAQWILDGDSYDGLIWLDNSDKPSEAEIEAFWPKVKSEIEAEAEAKAAQKAALLNRLGINEDEVKLLLA